MAMQIKLIVVVFVAISASRHGGQLVNEFFTFLEDITLSPGYLKEWRIFKVTAVILGPKNPFKNSCSRIVNAAVTLITSG